MIACTRPSLALGCLTLAACAITFPDYTHEDSGSGASGGSGAAGASEGGGPNGGGGKGGGNADGGAGGAIVDGGGGAGGEHCTAPDCLGDEPQGDCDGGLAIAAPEPEDGVRAMGLCKFYQAGEWGVQSAEWVDSSGALLAEPRLVGKGALPELGGGVPRDGQSLLALSTGTARRPTDGDYENPEGSAEPGDSQGVPPGYPKEVPSCPGVLGGDAYQSAGLRITVLPPSDARSFHFDSNVLSWSFPEFVCSPFSDMYVVMLAPKLAVLPDGNVAFDPNGNLLNTEVIPEYFRACSPQTVNGTIYACEEGVGLLQGSGFEGHGGTGWLQTNVPIESPLPMTLDFLVWDSGDGALDTTVLIDNFRFERDTATVGTIIAP